MTIQKRGPYRNAPQPGELRGAYTTHTCQNLACGKTFRRRPQSKSSRAYCSPACEREAKALHGDTSFHQEGTRQLQIVPHGEMSVLVVDKETGEAMAGVTNLVIVEDLSRYGSPYADITIRIEGWNNIKMFHKEDE